MGNRYFTVSKLGYRRIFHDGQSTHSGIKFGAQDRSDSDASRVFSNDVDEQVAVCWGKLAGQAGVRR